MRVMIVGALAWPIYEEAFAQGMRDNSVEVSAVSTSNFLRDFWGVFSKQSLFLALRYYI